ncbi:hypothetical protein CUJ83_10070 [Methanocella sp. CWC-04]|uniref:AB hydrolase-1 domain-containing protein n=1 Tax=Methanooceanicella nereidis TaxID=2052831 RepID=A0AAP2RFV5_9EURY|nr:alpha/beta hydrolase [Methanocella sp. CWC-04]MCD1295345.1 hypothetical protein [Methanocella sp. CWC-04]
MPKVKTNDIDTYYEIAGKGQPIVFIHGGFVDHDMWAPQVEYFSRKYKVITYDLRGHGKTGGSKKKKYSIELLADDLKALIDALAIEKPVICGLSLGGMVAQAFAVKYPDSLGALILSDTAISTALTANDKIQLYTLGWSMPLTLRLIGARRFVDYSFWMARVTKGERWFGTDEKVRDYVRQKMSEMDSDEMAKIYGAILGFRLLDLSSVRALTLITNGEFESESVLAHSKKANELIKNSTMMTIEGAGHTSNMENADGYNRALEQLLDIL